MAKIYNVLRYVDDVKPNRFEDATKVQWLNEVEGYIQTEVMMLALADVVQYDPEKDMYTELLVKPPHDKLYSLYLCALADFANGEYDKYNNTMQMYNKFLGEYIKWYTRVFHPADGECVREGYYLSAYMLAVRHGFEGTEEEWIASLKGETAYDDALLFGYTGTREDFGRDQAGFAENAAAVRLDRQATETAANEAEESAATATQQRKLAEEVTRTANLYKTEAEKSADAAKQAQEETAAIKSAAIQEIHTAGEQERQSVFDAGAGAASAAVQAISDRAESALNDIQQAGAEEQEAVRAAGTTETENIQSAAASAKNAAVQEIENVGEEQSEAVRAAAEESANAANKAAESAAQSAEEARQAADEAAAYEPEVFWAQYGVTPFADVAAAYDAGKVCVVRYSIGQYLAIRSSSITERFIEFTGTSYYNDRYMIRVTESDEWSVSNVKLLTKEFDVSSFVDSSSTNDKVPSAKATYDAILKYGGSGGSGGITQETDPTVPDWAKQPEKPTYTAADVGALPADTKIPEKTSEITNDSGFITKAVADLTNYYTKSQTYTQEEINALVSAIPKFTISVVPALPTSGISTTTVYLVKTGSDADLYTEYIYVNGAWEILGSQRVDLTGYAKLEDIPEPEVFIAEYGVTTFAEVEAAYEAGKLCVCRNAALWGFANLIGATAASFEFVMVDQSCKRIHMRVKSSGEWVTTNADLLADYDVVTSVDETSADNKVPSAKATYDAIQTYSDPAITEALRKAKESGEFDGAAGADGDDGITPHIGANGNWYIGETDTGIAAQGNPGRGITSVERTSGTGAAGTTDTYTITYTDGTTSTFGVYNGKNGTNGTNGTSVTVTNVQESTEDGGSNVVTFSDGKTLTVKNGKTGAKGDPGDDYILTDADKQEIAGMIPGGGGGSGTQVQPDWNQNDPTAADYVKNRPFYEAVTDVLPETELTFTANEELGGMLAAEIKLPKDLTGGNTYIVNFAGVEHKCTALDSSTDGSIYICLGNELFLGGEDTGEPFFYLHSKNADFDMELMISVNATPSATVSIQEIEIKKINPKYIPPEYIEVFDLVGAGLPTVSETSTTGVTDPMMLQNLITALSQKGRVFVRLNITLFTPGLFSETVWKNFDSETVDILVNITQSDGESLTATAMFYGHIFAMYVHRSAGITAKFTKLTNLKYSA